MMTPLWPRSFPEVVQIAERYRSAGQHLDAAHEFLKAAAVAPSRAFEDDILRRAWISSERARGQISELDRS